ncbi:MAG: GNAT family N-acetyltransferase [Verrucomicrobiota bacterium]
MSDLYRLATRKELDLAVEWARKEGWNPGIDDADIFWDSDPEGFVCVERGGEVIGTGSIVSYGDFGFMGFFIVREDLRLQGVGAPFWHWRKERLLDRLNSGGAIGMDGVFEMQSFYTKGGFEFSHRNIRMESVGQTASAEPFVVGLEEVPFGAVSDWDLRCFGFEREKFLRRWIRPNHGRAFGYWRDDQLWGFGVVRRCLTGFKIGPLFAENGEVAESLVSALRNEAVGEPLFLDVPENNAAAMELAGRHGMEEVFGCARMIAGPLPPIPWEHVFGVTTFELG